MLHSLAMRSLMSVGALLALVIAWIWPLGGAARDLLAVHMLQHIVAMNVGALLLAVAWCPRAAGGGPLPLLVAAVLQLSALGLWHLPAVFSVLHQGPALRAVMHGSLFVAALLFWCCVVGRPIRHAWQTIFALLVTAKMFCLLGAVLAFSRAPLFALHGAPERWGLSALEDQQLAGLLMIGSCAAVYVAAAVVLFVKWLVAMAAPSKWMPADAVAAE